jgi:hypothetical protein
MVEQRTFNPLVERSSRSRLIPAAPHYGAVFISGQRQATDYRFFACQLAVSLKYNYYQLARLRLADWSG